MRYICIDRRRRQYAVRMMCRVLKVSRSGYYAWRVRVKPLFNERRSEG